MTYKIEIWMYHSVIDTYESDDINKLVEWYKTKWQFIYDRDGCSFSVYEYGSELSFEEEYELGFYD